MARPRKPTALLESEGAYRKDPQRKRERGNEPQFTRGCECPKHLKGVALAKWRELFEELDRLNMLQRVDASALEAACIAYAEAVAADAQIAKTGLTYTVSDVAGNEIPRKRPEVEIRNTAWMRYKAFATEFGLTPASRSRLGTGKSDKPTTLSELLDRKSTPVIMDLSELQ